MKTGGIVNILDEYLTEAQVATIMGIEPKTLRNYISEGRRHPPFIGHGKGRRFPVDEFKKWVKQNLVHAINKAS